MTARLRLLLAILILALAPALAPAWPDAAVPAAMAAEPCDACPHACDTPCDAMDHGGPMACAGECLSHAFAPVLLAAMPGSGAPEASSPLEPSPTPGRLMAASWPPPVRPPCS